jgi:hypothetical protein
MDNTSELGVGWLYVITHANARGLVKIGITDRPTARMGELKDPEVLARVPVRHPRRHERRLHQKYEEQRLPQSEWFSLSPEQLEEVLEHVEQLAQSFLELVVLPKREKTEPEPEYETEGILQVSIETESPVHDPDRGMPNGWSRSHRFGWLYNPVLKAYYDPNVVKAYL